MHFALQTVRAYCTVGIEFLSIMEMCCRPQDKSIGVMRGFFGFGVNAEVLPIFYIVPKSYSYPKANAKISQRHWLLKTRPSTFTLATYNTAPPAYLSSAEGRAGQRLRRFGAVTLDRTCNECSVRHCSVATPSPACLSVFVLFSHSLPPPPSRSSLKCKLQLDPAVKAKHYAPGRFVSSRSGLR